MWASSTLEGCGCFGLRWFCRLFVVSCFMFLLLLLCFVVVVVHRLVGSDLTFFAVDYLVNPKGFDVWFKNPKGSGYWRIRLIPRSEFLRVCLKLLCLVIWFIRFSDIFRFVEICRFRGVLSIFTLVLLERAFYACCFQGAVGTWILIPCWRSIHSPYLNSKYSMQSSLFIYFF